MGASVCDGNTTDGSGSVVVERVLPPVAGKEFGTRLGRCLVFGVKNVPRKGRHN